MVVKTVYGHLLENDEHVHFEHVHNECRIPHLALDHAPKCTSGTVFGQIGGFGSRYESNNVSENCTSWYVFLD